MKLARRASTVTAIAAVVVGSALAFSAPASAAESAVPVAKYNGACGAGHQVIDSADIQKLGTTFLTYNNTTGENCVVTVRAKPGAAVHMFASLSSETGGKTTDSGQFTTYAGPVFLQARGSASRGRAASPPTPRATPVTAADQPPGTGLASPRPVTPVEPHTSLCGSTGVRARCPVTTFVIRTDPHRSAAQRNSRRE
ncbi:hypothetical protein NKH18_44065 [Streptomyces sp. M10(2022)]